MRSHTLRKSHPVSLVILSIFALTTASDAPASQRTILIGPLSFESQQKLLSFLPTVDIGTKKSFGHDYVPPSPCPVQVKGRLFASPGYMLSHHTLYLEMTYDDAQIKPGATMPVSFRAVPAGEDCFLKSGGGAIAEAKWRVGCAFLWVGGDIPYLPNFDLGFQAHVENYAAPMPNAGFKAGARSSLGSGLTVPLYQVGSQGKIFLKLKPGLFFKLGFKDLSGSIAVPESESVKLGNTEVQTGASVALAKSGTSTQTFTIKLPNDLGGTSDFNVLLSSIGYEDELKISPTVGFCLGVSISLTSSDDEEEGAEGGDGEPPDGEDNDYEIEASSEAFDFGEVSLSLSEIGYTTPTATWDLGALPGVGNLFQFGWNLPLNKEDKSGMIIVPPLPDLVVPIASASAAGAQFNVSAELDNQGTGPAGAFKVKWYVEQANGSAISGVSNPVWTDTINTLATGGYQTLTHSRNALPTGEYRVRILADTDGAAPHYQQVELCEINNNGMATFSSTLDLWVSLASPYLYRDASCTQVSPFGERLPGRQYYVKATVSRRATDVPVGNVPVEMWTLQHDYTTESQGQGQDFFTPHYKAGSTQQVGRKLVDLSSSTSATVVFPWSPPARVDASYEVRVKVDPEGQMGQYVAAGTDVTGNDMAWGRLPIKRPRLCTGWLGVWPGPGHTFENWGIGQLVKFRSTVYNYSPTNAHNVPVQLFVAGRKVAEAVVEVPAFSDSQWIEYETEFTRDFLYRENELGGGMAAPRILMAQYIDPHNQVEDQRDDQPGTNSWSEAVLAPSIGHLTIDIALPEEMYTGEVQPITATIANCYDQAFPGGELGKVPVSLKTVFGEGESHQEALIQQGEVSVGVGPFHGPVNGYHWYSPAFGALNSESWVPQQPGQYLLVASLDPPLPPGKAGVDDSEKYASDVQLFDNTVAKIATIGMPRPDLQAARVYVATMPSRSDLANLRRLSGRIADAFSGSPRAKEILGVSKDKAYAGAPVTIALDIVNPAPSTQYPVVSVPQARVNIYATYQPEWQKSPKLVELVEQWREIRDTQLPNLGRPIRQIALCDSGNSEPSAGLWLAPTHFSVSTPRRAVQINRPRATAADKISVRKSSLALISPTNFQYKGRDVFDVLREFNEKQVEVRLIGTCFLDRIEQGAVVSCQWRPPHGGKWLISAEIDPEDMIMERDETNNSVEMILDVRPSPHYFTNTPPCAIAGVRVGRGILRSELVESVLAQQAGPELAAPSVPELFPVDRSIKTLWDELREEVEQRSAGMPALAKRRTITIKQGQTFTLIGSRTIDREHDVVNYTWMGPNISIAGLEPDRIIDTSAPGYELSPGVQRYTLTVTDRAGLVSTDDVFVTVTSGSGKAADLVPVAISSLPSPMVPGQETTLSAVVQNLGSGNTDKAFVVRLNVGNTKLAEQTVSIPLNGGDAIEVVFENAWTPTAGLHQLKVQVDATNKVAEASESNNTLTVAQRIDGNAKPVADLGFTDFEMKSGEGLFLDAYRSFDPDGNITRYDWFVDNKLQTAYHGRRFRYEAPSRAGDHKVRLLVVDNALPTPKISDPVEATIHVVTDRQRAPVARLMPRLVVRQGRRVTIPATGCYDPDGTLQSYLWKIKGVAKAATGTQASYTVDTSQLKPGRYVVELTITDNANQSVKAEMPLYVVEAPNRAPIIQLPVAVSAIKGERATIDGSRCYDVDGTIAEYLWIVPKNGHVATGSILQLDTAELGMGAHTVILAVSDNLGATTTRPTTLWVLPPKGQPAYSETGYEKDKPMTEEELKETEGKKEESESSSGSVKPPSGAKPLPGSTKPKLPPIKR